MKDRIQVGSVSGLMAVTRWAARADSELMRSLTAKIGKLRVLDRWGIDVTASCLLHVIGSLPNAANY
ncbi:hypothetical protein ABC347_00330 [Sphingomonas sp. 1P06PA]|uniref:hypothetical protein n=1 Tax=Sphingomonas sp. 1P06PA TaxID=554121 RepID=UPI0039A60135